MFNVWIEMLMILIDGLNCDIDAIKNEKTDKTKKVVSCH
jgi:hypothetical protein